MSSLFLSAQSFWEMVFPKDADGNFHFLGQVSSMIIITLILSIIIIIIGLKIRKLDPLGKTPKWLVPIIGLVSMINNFTKQNIGKRWKSYAGYFLALAVFLCIMNISTIFMLTTPTSYIVINFALAIITFFIIQITGIRSQGLKGYLKSFIGPVPALSFLMIPMNIISEFALPISMTLRLMGNILSGAVLSKLIIGVAGWAVIPAMPFINAYFDVMSGIIQTFVFVMLTIIFTSMKIDDSEKIY